MNGLISKVGRFLISEDGPTAVEYAVMLALISVGLVSVVGGLTSSISGTFTRGQRHAQHQHRLLMT